jgi:2,3-diketo-5-methylthio-1-phosphopentane phosphatase
MKCHLLVDFDGTIAKEDTTDLLLEQFADPSWQEIEDEWKAGRIGSRECMVRQIDLVRATPDELDAFVAGIEIDPYFPEFVESARRQGHTMSVVSDGLDRTVGAVLRREGLDLPFHANHMQFLGGDRWRLTFPHSRSDCQSLAGNCKCGFVDEHKGMPRIVVGDGRSDFCVSQRADLVLAKGSLVRQCRASGLAHFAINDFAEAKRVFVGWVEKCVRVAEGDRAQYGDE